MGLKLLTLSYYAVTGRKVKLHKTGEKAKVRVSYQKRGMLFSLEFDNGRQEAVHWTQDMQGFIAADSDIDEVDEVSTGGVVAAV